LSADVLIVKLFALILEATVVPAELIALTRMRAWVEATVDGIGHAAEVAEAEAYRPEFNQVPPPSRE
jgi:hypothetical protein